MTNAFIKFVDLTKKTTTGCWDKHWDYCCENKIPFVTIVKSGSKFGKIYYDVFTIAKYERFIEIDYSSHVKALHTLFGNYNKVPLKNTFSGDRRGDFFVFKNDAAQMAEYLFDFLMVLAKQDQELFDLNPHTIDKEGCDSEGTPVAAFLEQLSVKSDYDLCSDYEMHLTRMSMSSPRNVNMYTFQKRKLFENELVSRKITKEKFNQILKSGQKRKSEIFNQSDDNLWDGYCPECALSGKKVRMKMNSQDFFECEESHLQIAKSVPNIIATILKIRGNGDFKINPPYGDPFRPTFWLCRQTLKYPPFTDYDTFQTAEERRRYIENEVEIFK